MILNATPVKVPKEEVNRLTFPSNDVLKYSVEVMTRLFNLGKAFKQGLQKQKKAKIIFEDAERLMCVESEIWDIKDQQIVLDKKGVCIPINRIHEVQFSL